MRFCRIKPERLGDIIAVSQTQQTDCKIPQGGHDTRRGFCADLTPVFIKRHVAHPMQAIFYAPVPAIEREKPLWRCLCFVEAGDAANYLSAPMTAVELRGDSFNAYDLFLVGEVEIIDQFRGTPYPAGFDPSVAFIYGFMLRGE